MGYRYQPSALPGGLDTKWYHASPSGLSRLWLHAQGGGAAAAAAAGSVFEQPSAPAGREAGGEGVAGGSGVDGGGGDGHPLVAFRHDFAAAASGTLGWAAACRVVETVLRLNGSTAALQLGSGSPPAALWRECDILKGGGAGHAGGGGRPMAAGPFVDEAAAADGVNQQATRPYARHRAEWVPDY